jgi:cytoskeletal protein RodZ
MSETHQATDKRPLPSFRPRPDGTIDPAGEAGWFLQRERERRGLDLGTAAQVLGVHASHLKGIEAGDLTMLPSRSEALAMIGMYGEYLGFEPKPLTQHYAGFLPRPIAVRKAPGLPPRPLSSAKIIPFSKALRLAMANRGLKIVSSIAGIAMLFAAAGAVLSPKGEEQTVANVDPLPTASVDIRADDGSAVKIEEAPLAEDLLIAQPAAREPPAEQSQTERGFDDLGAFIEEQLGAPASDLSIPDSVRTNRSTEPAPGMVASPEPPGSRIVLKAAGAVWFRVEDARGNVVISQTLRKGESYTVPDRDDLVIIARDGGMISYAIDGVDHGPLGTPGEIVVGRPLSVSKLMNNRG